MKRIFPILTIGVLFVFLPLINYNLADNDVAVEEIRLYIGETKLLPVHSPTRIVITNPNIADVANVSENTITLFPKAVGSTSLVFWDDMGEQSYRIRVLLEDMTDVKLRIDNLIKELNLPNVYTKAKDEEGKVLLLGGVKTSQDKDRLDLALGAFKEKTINLITIKEEAIVDIDVQVLELAKDATKTLGFTWPGGITLTDSSGPTSAAVTGLTHVFHVSDFTRTAFNITLDALIQEGKARILSQPRLACLSGKEAELLVGGEKPIMTTQIALAGSTTQVEYKEFGIKLKIKPTVADKDNIQLALNVEVSETGTAEFLGSTTQRTAQAYPLTKRNFSTELYLKDGQTLVIGGLIKQKAEEEIRKTAFLSDIPVVGALFRKKTTRVGGGTGERGDVELFITLTPTIVAGKEPTKETGAAQATESIPMETRPLAAEDNVLPELKDYIKTVQLKIINAVYYPQEAKELGWEGTVNLILRLASSGDLKEATISQSSGYKALDDAALEVVQKQSPYSAFPHQVKLEELKIQVPIVYRKN